MRLIRLVVQGYKRFADRTSVDTDDRLVALVGPNEAGKTSLLRALIRLNDDDPISSRDQTLGHQGPTELVGTFELAGEDVQAVDGVYGASELRRLVLRKTATGERYFDPSPSLKRDHSARGSALKALSAVASDPALDPAWGTEEHPWVEEDFETSRKILELDQDSLEGENLEVLERVVQSLAHLIYAPDSDAADGSAEPPVSDADGIASAVKALRAAIAAEHSEHPHHVAARVLGARVPRFAEFTAADRDLRSEYSLEELASPPAALRNLAFVAGLDLRQLYQALQDSDAARTEELLDAAHVELEKVYSRERWRQADLEIRIRNAADNSIRIVVRNKNDRPFSYMEERSAGLRWFVALSAFLFRVAADQEAILLIDEAEQHLHYDAQAEAVPRGVV